VDLSHSVLSVEDERGITERAATGDCAAIEELVRHNQRLIADVAVRYLHMAGDNDIDDLMQAGNVGLLRAIRKFEPGRNLKFSTYATYWVRAEIARLCHKQAHALSVSVGGALRMIQVRKAVTRLHTLTGKEPTLPELAIETGATENQLRDLLQVTTCLSLDADEPGSSDTIHEWLIGEDGVEETAIDAALVAAAMQAIRSLPEYLRRPFLDYCGLNPESRAYSMIEIAKRSGVSIGAAQDLIETAIQHIRSRTGN
jgi:RNA polymerase sigma factor (sigma-70 family)